VRQNENFYLGEQWQGLNAPDLDKPVLNFLKRVCSYLSALLVSDDIAVELELPVHRVLSALTMLEIAGYAATTGGRGFIRTVHIEEKHEEEEA